MNCSNPGCNRGIGLVAYRRGLFGKRRYCSRNCRDAFVADTAKLEQKRSEMTYFDWLISQRIDNTQLHPAPTPTPNGAQQRPICCIAKTKGARDGQANSRFEHSEHSDRRRDCGRSTFGRGIGRVRPRANRGIPLPKWPNNLT
jgi:hypothetical protein